MFYVHLFLKAMYREGKNKQNKNKSTLYFQRSASTHAWQSEVWKPQRAVASHVKQVEQKSKHCD